MRYWKGTVNDMEPTKPVRGKVAQVLNDREVAINRGANDGVEPGAKFNILSHSQEIKDPDTGETLGSIDRAKVAVRVTAVYDRLSVAETFDVRKVNVGGNGIGIGIFTPPKWENHYVTLKQGGGEADDVSELDRFVAIGDPVVQIIEPESAAARESARAGATA